MPALGLMPETVPMRLVQVAAGLQIRATHCHRLPLHKLSK
jgi:hypothetical protein